MSDVIGTKTLNFINNKLTFSTVTGIESLRQRIISYLYFFSNTYFLNDNGFDYLNTPRKILQSQINNGLLERFADEIIEINDLNFDLKNEELSFTLNIVTVYGGLDVRT